LIPEYGLEKDFGGVRVYSRKRKPYRPGDAEGQRWFELIDHAISSRLFGMVQGHWVMGDLHAAQGKGALAAWMYDRARAKRNFEARLFQWGAGEAAAGRTKASASALVEIAGWLRQQSPRVREAFRTAFAEELKGLEPYRTEPGVADILDLFRRTDGPS
jgi:hypothetical protein